MSDVPILPEKKPKNEESSQKTVLSTIEGQEKEKAEEKAVLDSIEQLY
jgi:hypothetical protein